MVDATGTGDELDVLKDRVAEAVERSRDEILELSHAIHARPELAYDEVEAARLIADSLRRHGYVVEHPAGRLPTAIRGHLPALGFGRPSVAVLAEYDALPGVGHGCGHNTMAASGVGAAIALATLEAHLPGSVVFLGTPAEEVGCGKVQMIEDGLFRDLDAALMFHPADRTVRAGPDNTSLESEDFIVTFRGHASHASTDPWHGRNALDGLVSLYTSIAMWRQQVRPDARIHGVIREGGLAVNIIPERAVGHFRLRSPEEQEFLAMVERFETLVSAAAAATATDASIERSSRYRAMRTCVPYGEAWNANLAALGQVLLPGDPTRAGSTDMGNVSRVVPTIHPNIAIADDGTPAHSTAFAEAARGPLADSVTLIAATAVARTALDVLYDPALRAAAWEAFSADGPS